MRVLLIFVLAFFVVGCREWAEPSELPVSDPNLLLKGVDADGNVKPERIVTVVDCGQVVSPGTVEAQVQGGIVFGLSAALFGNISIKDGRVEQSNFHDYRVLRMNEMPVMETHVIPSTEEPTGIGEIATVVITIG